MTSVYQLVDTDAAYPMKAGARIEGQWSVNIRPSLILVWGQSYTANLDFGSRSVLYGQPWFWFEVGFILPTLIWVWGRSYTANLVFGLKLVELIYHWPSGELSRLWKGRWGRHVFATALLRLSDADLMRYYVSRMQPICRRWRSMRRSSSFLQGWGFESSTTSQEFE